tara:strand:+ start:506 stop:817 length:312 start_codon:yes stop_codon:yes gene_type:complete
MIVGHRLLSIYPERGAEIMDSNEENTTTEHVNEMPSLLVGYIRLSQAGKALNVSINTNALGDCRTYNTADGQSYTSLVISLDAMRKVMNGDRVVTTVSQLIVD